MSDHFWAVTGGVPGILFMVITAASAFLAVRRQLGSYSRKSKATALAEMQNLGPTLYAEKVRKKIRFFLCIGAYLISAEIVFSTLQRPELRLVELLLAFSAAMCCAAAAAYNSFSLESDVRDRMKYMEGELTAGRKKGIGASA